MKKIKILREHKILQILNLQITNYKFLNVLIHKLSRKCQNLRKPQGFLFGKVSPPKVDAPCDENLVKNTISKVLGICFPYPLQRKCNQYAFKMSQTDNAKFSFRHTISIKPEPFASD